MNKIINISVGILFFLTIFTFWVIYNYKTQTKDKITQKDLLLADQLIQALELSNSIINEMKKIKLHQIEQDTRIDDLNYEIGVVAQTIRGEK